MKEDPNCEDINPVQGSGRRRHGQSETTLITPVQFVLELLTSLIRIFSPSSYKIPTALT